MTRRVFFLVLFLVLLFPQGASEILGFSTARQERKPETEKRRESGMSGRLALFQQFQRSFSAPDGGAMLPGDSPDHSRKAWTGRDPKEHGERKRERERSCKTCRTCARDWERMQERGREKGTLRYLSSRVSVNNRPAAVPKALCKLPFPVILSQAPLTLLH